MSTSQSQTVHSHHFAIRLGDRTLPGSASSVVDRDTTSLDQPYEILQTEAALAELSQYLEQQLKERVLVGELIVNAITLKQAIERYGAHIEQLQKVCNEWLAMLAQLVHFNGRWKTADVPEALSGQVDEEIAKWRDNLLHAAKADTFANETIVTAKLAVKPLPLVKVELANHIQESLTRAKTTMLNQLVNLVDHEVIGIIEWYAPENCCYHYYMRECDVELKNSLIATKINKLAFAKYRKIQTLYASGTAQRSLVRRVQHLVDAHSFSLGQNVFPIPRRQASIVADLPTWIKPALKVVEGTLIRETIVTQDQGCQRWDADRVVVDKVQWHTDPALVLGPFVLSGWGQAEIEAEMALRREEARAAFEAQQPVCRAITTPKMLGYLTLALACAFVVSWRSLASNLVMGMVCGVAACTLLSCRWNKALMEHGETDLAIGYAISTVAMSLLAMLLIPVGFSIAGLAFFLLALLALALYAHRTSEWDEIREEPHPPC